MLHMLNVAKQSITKYLSRLKYNKWANPQDFGSIAHVQESSINTHTDVSSRSKFWSKTSTTIYIYTLCKQATKAQASLRKCADLPEPLLLNNAISSKISCIDTKTCSNALVIVMRHMIG